MIPSLAIIQARLHSTRIPRKMLQLVGGKPLLWWGWHHTVQRYGFSNTVIACPSTDTELEDAAPGLFFWYDGEEWDVLGRFHACAHRFRTTPESVIVRITPDDFPVDLDREQFAMEDLDWAQESVAPRDRRRREHIGYLFAKRPLSEGSIEVNTMRDLEMVRALQKGAA